eukprot:4774067-Pyramimonas_sp.AAC.1
MPQSVLHILGDNTLFRVILESDDVYVPRPVVMAPRGSVATSSSGGEDPCGTDQLVERSCADGVRIGIGVFLRELDGPEVHGWRRSGARLTSPPELSSVDPTSGSSEVSRFLMPYPSDQPG